MYSGLWTFTKSLAIMGQAPTPFRRFRRWALKGVFKRVFEVLSVDADFEYVLSSCCCRVSAMT